jgi:hypothetical protein
MSDLHECPDHDPNLVPEESMTLEFDPDLTVIGTVSPTLWDRTNGLYS